MNMIMCCLLHHMMSHQNAQCYTHRVPFPPATVSVQSPGDLASGSQHARALEFCTHLPLYVCRNPVASFSGLLASHHPDLTTCIKAIKN